MNHQDDKIYLRPSGLVNLADHGALIETGEVVPLAGGPIGFSWIEIIHRRRNGQITKEFSRASDLNSVRDLVGEQRITHLIETRKPLLDLTWARPRIMGVLNVTPDSFSDGGRFTSVEDAAASARAMFEAGADIVDIGGESTRPRAEPVEPQEELRRVMPVFNALNGDTNHNLSIDTRKAEIMKAAIDAGARLINDISALTYDADSLSVAARSQVPIVLMHTQGDPASMQDNPNYNDVLLDVYDYLEERINACEAAGIPRERLIVDPGIGFGKSVEHNLRLFGGLCLFHGLGCAVLLGASRKSFIGYLHGGAASDQRLGGSLAAVLVGAAQGVQLFRVHDVRETHQTVTVLQGIYGLK